MRDSTYPATELTSRPSIISVVSNYTSLRRVGSEELGLCPLHGEKTPSFRVNEDKGVFHCFGCGAGGDVFRFIELVEGVPFKEALSLLGMTDNPPPPPAARQISRWINDQIAKMNFRLRELDEMLHYADELGDVELQESIWRERRLVADFRDDVGRFEYRADFVAIKDVIEKITRSFE
jgi:hypothetical protein